jgi:phytoene/squalene synthetase
MKTKVHASVEDHPSVIEKRREIANVAERMRQAERREQAARQRLRDLAPVIRTADVDAKKNSAAAKVKKLLAGGTVSSTDPKAELAAAESEQSMLHGAQIELNAELRQIIGELSDEFGTDYLEPRVRDDTVAIYGLLAEAAAVMARVRGRTADAVRLGYRVSSGHCIADNS